MWQHMFSMSVMRTQYSTLYRQLENQAPNTAGSSHLYDNLELLMMGIKMPETFRASSKICNKNSSVASSWHFISTYCFLCYRCVPQLQTVLPTFRWNCCVDTLHELLYMLLLRCLFCVWVTKQIMWHQQMHYSTIYGHNLLHNSYMFRPIISPSSGSRH
jgi:hypothetical protein